MSIHLRTMIYKCWIPEVTHNYFGSASSCIYSKAILKRVLKKKKFKVSKRLLPLLPPDKLTCVQAVMSPMIPPPVLIWSKSPNGISLSLTSLPNRRSCFTHQLQGFLKYTVQDPAADTAEPPASPPPQPPAQPLPAYFFCCKSIIFTPLTHARTHQNTTINARSRTHIYTHINMSAGTHAHIHTFICTQINTHT